MSILVECQCGKTITTADANAGRRAKCPACGCILTIPGSPAVQVRPAASSTSEVLSRQPADSVAPAPPPDSAANDPKAGESLPAAEVLALSTEHPLFAEVCAKGGLAIWAVLTFLMIGFSAFRESSLIGAIFWLLVAVIIYLVATAILIGGKGGWITPETGNPVEKRIYTSMMALSSRAGLPMPGIALDDEPAEINAYTFGFSRQFAKVRITKGFMDHVMPTDEELDAVLAHELGHIKRGDFVISTCLQFPIWLMDKFRTLLHFIRSIGVLVLRVVSEVAFGWIGLLIVLGLLGMLLYLSLAIAALTASIFICIFFINLFEREREYLADEYSVELTGRPGALQSVLAKLELAARRVAEEIQKRAAATKEGQQIDTHVAPPEAALSGDSFIQSALSHRISFAETIQKGECFLTHPLTENRVYFLNHPEQRTRALSNLLTKLGSRLDTILRRTADLESEWKNRSLALGVGLGLCVAIIPALFRHWIFFVLLGLLALAAAAGMGWSALRQRWGGLTFIRSVALASYVSATALLVVGPMARNRWTMAYPGLFLISLILFGVCGLLAHRLLRRFQPDTQH